MSRKTCRTCFGDVSPQNCTQLAPDDEISTFDNVFEMLNFCIPELDMYVVADAVICKPCQDLLKTVFVFKRKCVESEEKITNYLYLNKVNGQECDQVDLNLVKDSCEANNNFVIKEESLTSPLEIVIKPEPDSPPFRFTKKLLACSYSSSAAVDEKFANPACRGCLTSSVDPSDHVRVPTPVHCCHNCGKTLTTIVAFRKHVDNHIRRNPCRLCGKRFRNPSGLESHLLTHTGAKPFQCQRCGKRFQQNYTLKQHERNHDEATSLRCQICSKTCSTKYNLKVHMAVHGLGARRYRCDECGNAFFYKMELKKHKLMVHNQDDDSS